MKQLLLTILCAFCCLAAAAQSSFYDFQVEGVCYKIVDNTATSKTCEIVGKYEDGRSSYDDIFTEPVDLTIPSTVLDRTRGTAFTVVAVGNQAFKKATKLHGINLPASVTTIGVEAFYASGFTSISMPGVRSIGARAFRVNQHVSYGEWPVNLETIGTDAFYGEATGIMHFYNLRTIEPSDGTDYFAHYSQIYCYTAIPPTVTGVKLDKTAPVHVPQGCLAAYKAADGWKDVWYLSDDIIAEANDHFNAGLQFAIISSTEVALTGISDANATKVEVPSKATIGGREYTVTMVADGAFKSNTKLTTVLLPSTITVIGKQAFENCTALTFLPLPKGLKEIRSEAFYATPIATVDFPEGLEVIGGFAFKNCVNLTSIVVPSSVKEIGNQAFCNCSKLVRAEVNAAITTAASYLFANCTSLKEIILPRSVTTIADAAFQATALSSFVVPEGVNSVGQYAFRNCTKLTSIEFPTTLTSLGSNVLNNCIALEVVSCHATTLPTTNSNAFANTPNDFFAMVPVTAYESYKADAAWGPYVGDEIDCLPAPVTITYSGGKLKFESGKDVTGPIYYTIEVLDDNVQGATTSGQLTLSGAPADSKPLHLLVTAYCDIYGYGPSTKSTLVIECPSDYTGDLDHNGVINSNDIVVLTNKVLGK